MRHQLFHVVLLLFICGVAVISAVAGRAYACDYDEIKKETIPPVVVVRELPKNGQDSSQTNTLARSENGNWEPLRIRVSTKDLIKGKYCEERNEKRMNFLNGDTVWCPPIDSDFMTEEKKNTIINEILPEAIKLHTDRLLVQRVKSPLQVPDFGNNSICSRFTVPSGHHAPGVPDADFVLYVAAGPGDYSFSTWAVTCAIDAQSKRPIVGAMNINPRHAFFTRVNVRYAAHVLAHALGFDYKNMKERKMTKEVAKKEGKERTVIKSEKVLLNAKKHYNCDTMGEVQLEYAGEGQPTSHWDRCNAKDELMSVHMSRGRAESIGYYTALTIAAFEDLGFFKGNFKMSETMTWGYHKNCEFLKTPCKKKDDELNSGVGGPRAMVESCTSDRQGRYSKLKESTPDYRFLGPDRITSCDRAGSGTGVLLGLPRKDSWCLDVDSINTTYDYIITRNAVCAAVNCDDDDGVVFKVQLNTNGKWYNCMNENGSITPDETDDPTSVSGTVKCPKYSEVCTIKGNGSSHLRLQEEKKIPLEIPEIPASSTTENQVTNVPSSSGSHAGQNSQTSTVNNAQGAPSTSTATGGNREEDSTTPTPGETTNNTTTQESSVDSNIVNGEEHTPISKTPNDKETLNDINIQNNTTESILNISFAGKDNSQVTKVYPPFLLLVLVILNLLVSF